MAQKRKLYNIKDAGCFRWHNNENNRDINVSTEREDNLRRETWNDRYRTSSHKNPKSESRNGVGENSTSPGTIWESGRHRRWNVVTGLLLQNHKWGSKSADRTFYTYFAPIDDWSIRSMSANEDHAQKKRETYHISFRYAVNLGFQVEIRRSSELAEKIDVFPPVMVSHGNEC